MKLLLINTVTPERTIENIYPPLGLAYIASYVREHINNITFRIIEGNVKEELNKFQPDLVGISSVSQNYGIAINIARICKKRGVPVIIGGTHISSLPSSLAPEMDLAVMGEGEQTMLAFVDVFLQHGLDIDKIKKVPGIAYRNGKGDLIFTRGDNIIEPLDKVPFPARDLLRIPKRGQLYLFSSRGCPYRCTFCQSTRFFQKIRSFSPGYVIRELKFLIREYKPVSICFYDDLFVSNKNRFREIVRLIEEERINKQAEFYVNVRADQADEETAELLKKMNVSMVNMGLESGSEKILQYLKPKHSSVQQNIRALEIFNKAGLRTNCSFIIGVVGETKDDILKTYNFIRKNKLSSFTTYILVPYPNTPLWGYALEKGLVSEKMDWQKLRMEVLPNFEGERVILSELGRKELYKLYTKFQRLSYKKQFSTRLKIIIEKPNKILPALIKKFQLWWKNYREPIGKN